MNKRLFLTGMSRSGTTLLDKLLNAQEGVKIYSQPLPYLFRHIKKALFTSLGIKNEYYVLNDYFHESRFSYDQLQGFIKNYQLESNEIDSVLSEMQSFTGQYTSVENAYKDSAVLAHNESFSQALNRLLDNNCTSQKYSLIGLKEVMCEDFAPYLISEGYKVILIVRNPYDVLTSIQFGKGNIYTGKKRPSLFHLRNWRKSVAFSIILNDDPKVFVLRYEDLITNTENMLQRISAFLEEDISIEDLNGEGWEGNSSFPGASSTLIDQSTLNRYQQIMPKEMQAFISYMCEPELKLLGYPLHHFSAYDPSSYREPFTVEADDFDDTYSSTPLNIKQEKNRREYLLSGASEIPIASYFIDSKVFNALRIQM